MGGTLSSLHSPNSPREVPKFTSRTTEKSEEKKKDFTKEEKSNFITFLMSTLSKLNKTQQDALKRTVIFRTLQINDPDSIKKIFDSCVAQSIKEVNKSLEKAQLRNQRKEEKLGEEEKLDLQLPPLNKETNQALLQAVKKFIREKSTVTLLLLMTRLNQIEQTDFEDSPSIFQTMLENWAKDAQVFSEIQHLFPKPLGSQSEEKVS